MARIALQRVSRSAAVMPGQRTRKRARQADSKQRDAQTVAPGFFPGESPAILIFSQVFEYRKRRHGTMPDLRCQDHAKELYDDNSLEVALAVVPPGRGYPRSSSTGHAKAGGLAEGDRRVDRHMGPHSSARHSARQETR